MAKRPPRLLTRLGGEAAQEQLAHGRGGGRLDGDTPQESRERDVGPRAGEPAQGRPHQLPGHAVERQDGKPEPESQSSAGHRGLTAPKTPTAYLPYFRLQINRDSRTRSDPIDARAAPPTRRRLAGQAPTKRCGSPPAVLRGSATRTWCLARRGGRRRRSAAGRAGRAPRRRACSGYTR